MPFLREAVVFLIAAVVAVPIFKRLGLGSVLGYLAAGIVIGPSGASLITDVEAILHVSELGVVLLLFVIGLELQPSRLWAMRRSVFGLGVLQVGATTALLMGVALIAGLRLSTALIAAIGLSLSSTAFALQLLAEKNQLTTDHGKASFRILLFQDLAVIPVLAFLPLLGTTAAESTGPMWLSALKAIGVLVAVFLGGKFLVRPVFRLVASVHSQELFTAATLLVVVGTAVLVSLVGLSMALGAFLAGVLLAESEYRHELEADIEPFKGLLLGLFFIAVGMSADVGVLLDRPLLVASLVIGLVAAKAAVLWAIGRKTFGNNEAAFGLAVAISQGGEFAFVLFGLAVGHGIMDRALADLLIVVVSLSLAVTPILSLVYEKYLRPKLATAKVKREFDVAPDQDHPVIIAGFGRVGQVVGRVLHARRIGFTALDASPDHIDFLRRFGNKIFYGDASRVDMLRAARADKAKIFVLAIDDVEASIRTAEMVQKNFPHLTIFARARNRQHAYRLLDLGVKHLMRETFASSLDLTQEILQELGLPFLQSKSTIDRFKAYDEDLLMTSYKHHQDVGKLTEIATAARQQLEQLFEQDEAEQKKSA